LVSSVDNDGRVPYEIQVIDDKGNVIESMVSHRKNNLTRQYDLAAGGKLLSELYEYARREALGVDEKLDALLADLPPLPHDEDEFVEEDTEDT